MTYNLNNYKNQSFAFVLKFYTFIPPTERGSNTTNFISIINTVVLQKYYSINLLPGGA